MRKGGKDKKRKKATSSKVKQKKKDKKKDKRAKKPRKDDGDSSDSEVSAIPQYFGILVVVLGFQMTMCELEICLGEVFASIAMSLGLWLRHWVHMGPTFSNSGQVAQTRLLACQFDFVVILHHVTWSMVVVVIIMFNVVMVLVLVVYLPVGVPVEMV